MSGSPRAVISVGILGPLEMSVGSRPIELRAAKLRILLSVLIVSANRVVPSDELIEVLWGDHPPSGVRTTLQGYVHRLRKALEAGPNGDPRVQPVVTGEGGYALRLGPDDLDAARFEAGVREARRHLTTAPATASALLADALALWRGPALADVSHLGFAQPEAARLDEARLRAAEDRFAAEMALGRHAEVAGELGVLARAHPLREHLAARHMLALYRSGRQAEALRSYQQLRRHLNEELGIDPSPEVTALEEAILLQKPELQWVPPDALGGPTRDSEPPLRVHPPAPSSPQRAADVPPKPASGRGRSPVTIGREAERRTLAEALASATAGRPSVVVVAGDAGMGKSRLVDELVAAGRTAGAIVLAGGCSALPDAQVPFGPVAEALRGHLASLETTDVEELIAVSQGALARVVPELAVDGGGELDPTGAARLPGLLLGVLARLAQDAPVVIVLEDLHWADSSTSALVEFLARNLGRLRLLVVVSTRTDELAPHHPTRAVLAALGRGPTTTHIELGPLGEDDVRRLAEEIMEGPADAGLLDDITARAGGNALFVEELVAGHREGTTLRRTLREMLVARTEPLGPRAAACLRVLAVAARPLEHAVLAEASGLAEADLINGLRAAVDHQVVIAEGDTYRFGHALMAEAHAAHLLPGERAAIHAALAAAGARAGAAPTEVAHHWLHAGDAAHALPVLLQAAEVAERALAHTQAVAFYEKAIGLWGRVPDAAERAGIDLSALLERAADAATLVDDVTRVNEVMRVGDLAQCRRAMQLGEEAVAHLDADAEPLRAGVLHAKIGSYRWQAGLDGRAHWAEALRLLPAEPITAERTEALARYADGLANVFRSREAVAIAQEAVAAAQRLGDKVLEAQARRVLGSASGDLGDLDTARVELRRAMVLAEEAGKGDASVLAHGLLWATLWMNDRHEEAMAVSLRGAEVARRFGLGEATRAATLGRKALHLQAIGQWDEFEELLAELGDGWHGRWRCISASATIAAARGDAAGVQDIVGQERSKGTAEEESSVLAAAEAQLALWLRRPADAADLVDAALSGLDTLTGAQLAPFASPLCLLGIRAQADLAELHQADHGDPGPARDRGQQLLDRLRNVLADPVQLPFVRASGITGEAEATRLMGQPDVRRWSEAVRAWEGTGRVYPLAWVQWRAAEAILLDGGSRAEAAELLHLATTTARRLRLGPLKVRLEELAARHHLTSELAAAEPPPVLRG